MNGDDPVALTRPLTVAVEVLPNADLLVVEQNVVEDKVEEQGKAAGGAERRVARVLDLAGDLGVWAEWVAGKKG